MKKLLLDECVPKKLKQFFDEHEVTTVQEMGWSQKGNGELLKLAEASFDVFLTVDKNLEHQQEYAKLKLSIIVLDAWSNRVQVLKDLVPDIKQTLNRIETGQLVRLFLKK